MSLPMSPPNSTLGSLLVGGLLAMALWGVTCVQTYNYFVHKNKDGPAFRLLISLLLALDTFDSALNAHILYHYTVTNYFNPLALLIPVWSVIIHVAATSISNFVIRAMFAYRVYRLSHENVLLTAGIMALSITDLVTGLVITVKAFELGTYEELASVANLLYLNFAAGASSDLFVAFSLLFFLCKSKTGYCKTDSLICVLMLFTVNTGIIVALDAALGMILYIVMPNNFVFLAFYLLLSKLYLNSYLAALNARERIRRKHEDNAAFHLSEMSGARFDEVVSMPAFAEKSHISSPETLAYTVQSLVPKSVSPLSSGSNAVGGNGYEARVL